MVPVLVQVVEKSGVFLAALIRPSEKQGGTRGGAGGAGVRDEDGALLMLFEVEASELPRAEVLIQFCSSGGTFGAPGQSSRSGERKKGKRSEHAKRRFAGGRRGGEAIGIEARCRVSQTYLQLIIVVSR